MDRDRSAEDTAPSASSASSRPVVRVVDLEDHPLTDASSVASGSQQERHPRGPLRLHSDRFFDVVHPPIPSPPYKRVASSSHLPLDYEAQSPAYRSENNLPLMASEHDSPTTPELGHDRKKPSVHYTDGVEPATLRSNASRLNDTPMYHPLNPMGHKLQRTMSTATDDDDDDDEFGDDDYDWSADEDLGEEEAKFEQRMGKKTRPKGWFRKLLALLFGSLIGTIITAGLLVTGPILVHFFWYKPHPTEHRRYVLDNIEAWLFWAAANVLISWWLALLIDLVPSTARWLVAAFWGHVSEAVKTNLELYNSVDDNIKPVFYAASGWLSWVIIFQDIYNLNSTDENVPSRASYTNRLDQVVEFLFFLALVWCIQRMASHLIAFGFHQVAFKERIDDLRHRLRVIEHLRDYRPKKRHSNRPGSKTALSAFLSPGVTPTLEKAFAWNTGKTAHVGSRTGSPSATCSESEFEGDVEESNRTDVKGKGKDSAKRQKHRQSGQGGSGGGRLSRLFDSPARVASPTIDDNQDRTDSPHRYPPSPAGHSPPRKASGKDSDSETDVVAHAAKVLKNAVLHDARNIQGKDALDTGLAWDVTSPNEAKRLARRIYQTFRRDRRRNYLLPCDFEPAYATPEEANAAFRVFDEDNNGDLSRAEIKAMLVKTYKERRFISRSIRDVGEALQTLNKLLFALGIVILFLISLSVFGIDISKTLTSFYSIAIAASFVFKSSAASVFDSIMFLFVTHPFDTGDRCFIGTENLVVKKMGLFATVFTRADGAETYYFNSMLFNMFITNSRRSDKTSETMTMQMEWRTPMEKIQALEDALNDWLAHEENRWFQPNTSIVFQNFQLQRYLEVTIGISHNGNWQDWGLRNSRRTAFQAAVQHYCLQLGIRAYKPPLPIRWADSVNAEPLSPVPSHLDAPGSPMMEVQPGEGDNLAAPDMHEGATGGAAPPGAASSKTKTEAAAGGQETVKSAWLGFTPRNEGAMVRARKSKSRKPQGLDGSI